MNLYFYPFREVTKIMGRFKESTEKFKEKLKNKKTRQSILFFIVALIVVGGVLYGIGYAVATVNINGEKLTYDGLVAEIKLKKEEINELNAQYDDAEEQLDNKQEALVQAQEIIDKSEQLQADFDTLQSDYDTKKSELESINKQISDKQEELASLEGKIVEQQEENKREEIKANTKTLSTGNYIVGIDIGEGTYNCTAASGNGNFIVYSASGNLKVNEMFGTDTEWYTNSFNNLSLSSGDTIEIMGGLVVQFTPVQ